MKWFWFLSYFLTHWILNARWLLHADDERSKRNVFEQKCNNNLFATATTMLNTSPPKTTNVRFMKSIWLLRSCFWTAGVVDVVIPTTHFLVLSKRCIELSRSPQISFSLLLILCDQNYKTIMLKWEYHKEENKSFVSVTKMLIYWDFTIDLVDFMISSNDAIYIANRSCGQ